MRLAVYPVKLVPQKNLLFTMNKPAVADFPDMESPSTYTQVSLSNALIVNVLKSLESSNNGCSGDIS